VGVWSSIVAGTDEAGWDKMPTLSDLRARQIRHARRRVWSVVGIIAVGIWLGTMLAELAGGSWITPSWIAATVLAIAGSAVIARNPNRATWIAPALLALATCCSVASYSAARLASRASDHLSLLAGEPTRGQGRVVQVEGLLLTNWEREVSPSDGLSRFIVRAPTWTSQVSLRTVWIGEAQHPADCSGMLCIAVTGEPQPPSHAGNLVRVLGVWEPPKGLENPGDAIPHRFALQDQLAGTLRVSGAELVVTREDALNPHAILLRTGGALRERLQRVLDHVPAGPARELLGALLLGEREFERTDAGLSYTRLGLSHILSISGFHLTVLVFSVLWLLRLTGDRGWIEPAILALMVLGYALALPSQAPILRSAALVLCMLLVHALGRRYDRLCVLGWITIALLAWRPADLWSLGFQLSVGLTALLLWIGDRSSEAMWGVGVQGVLEEPRVGARGVIRSLTRGFKSSMALSAMCWTCALPIIAATTGVVSPLAAIVSIILAPLFVVLLWLGYLTLGIGMLLPAFASWAGRALSWLCDLAIGSATWIDSIMLSSVRVPVIPMWWTLLATIWIVCGWRWYRAWVVADRRWWWGLGACVIAALLPSMIAARGNGLDRGSTLRVDMLSVGDGTCMLIRSGHDALLWDAKGIPPRSATPRTVLSLRELGVWRVPRIVITHPDIDHMSGVLDLLEPLGVREVLVSTRFVEQAQSVEAGRNAARVIQDEFSRRGVKLTTLRAADEFFIGPARATVISPPASAQWPSDNDHSLMALLEAPRAGFRAPARMLLTGDVGAAALARIEHASLPVVDAIELPHHGSPEPAAMRLVGRVQPRVILQSTGPSRLDDPRWEETRVALPEARWLVTAREGWSAVTWRHDGTMVVHTMRIAP
jgi:competence protein ComEC